MGENTFSGLDGCDGWNYIIPNNPRPKLSHPNVQPGGPEQPPRTHKHTHKHTNRPCRRLTYEIVGAAGTQHIEGNAGLCVKVHPPFVVLLGENEVEWVPGAPLLRRFHKVLKLHPPLCGVPGSGAWSRSFWPSRRWCWRQKKKADRTAAASAASTTTSPLVHGLGRRIYQRLPGAQSLSKPHSPLPHHVMKSACRSHTCIRRRTLENTRWRTVKPGRRPYLTECQRAGPVRDTITASFEPADTAQDANEGKRMNFLQQKPQQLQRYVKKRQGKLNPANIIIYLILFLLLLLLLLIIIIIIIIFLFLQVVTLPSAAVYPCLPTGHQGAFGNQFTSLRLDICHADRILHHYVGICFSGTVIGSQNNSTGKLFLFLFFFFFFFFFSKNKTF